jgi:hypothetical protein
VRCRKRGGGREREEGGAAPLQGAFFVLHEQAIPAGVVGVGDQHAIAAVPLVYVAHPRSPPPSGQVRPGQA